MKLISAYLWAMSTVVPLFFVSPSTNALVIDDGPSLTEPQIFPSNPEALAVAWERYILSIPVSVNPVLDATGERCAIGQSGPYWFLVGSFGGSVSRSCTIPAGTKLFFPVVQGVNISTGETSAQLLAQMKPCFDAAINLSVEVDGAPVSIGAPNRVTSSSGFRFALPPDNLFGQAPGVYRPAVVDGYYVALKALPVGRHTVRIRGTVPGVCASNPSGFAVDVLYNLRVRNGSHM